MNNKRDVFTARHNQDCREFVSIDFTITVFPMNHVLTNFYPSNFSSLFHNYSLFIDHVRQLYYFNSCDHIYLT